MRNVLDGQVRGTVCAGRTRQCHGHWGREMNRSVQQGRSDGVTPITRGTLLYYLESHTIPQSC
jgi:hypothetical protein